MKRHKSSKKLAASQPVPVRNPVASNPLLRKSSAHGKTRKADRRAEKVSLRKMTFERVACLQAIGSKVILRANIFAAV